MGSEQCYQKAMGLHKMAALPIQVLPKGGLSIEAQLELT